MIGFRRQGPDVVAVVEENEAQVMALVVAQVAGLIELSRTELEAGEGSDLDTELAELDDLGEPVERPAAAPPGPLAGPVLDLGLAPEDAGTPADPVLARLFPDGYRDDPEAAAELRAMIQGDLHTQKLDHASTLLATLPLTGGEVRLDEAQAESWLLALNDARLALGTRLDVTDDMDILDELDEAVLRDPAGPRVLALGVYHLLGYAQETLIDALTG